MSSRASNARRATERPGIAVVDESSPGLPSGGVLYSLAATHTTRAELDRLVATLPAVLKRKNPLHWEREGPKTRQLILNELASSEIRLVCAAGATSPRGQANLRAELWREFILPDATRHGVGQLVIESRSQAEDEADGKTIRNWCRDRRVTMFDFSFARKSDPATWLADVAAGLWAETCLGRDSGLMQLLRAGRVRQATKLDR